MPYRLPPGTPQTVGDAVPSVSQPSAICTAVPPGAEQYMNNQPAGSTLAQPDFGPAYGVHLSGQSLVSARDRSASNAR
jgi:hypothetical protein